MDKIEELKKLKQLLDHGLITSVEYDSLKADIIDIKPAEEPKMDLPIVPVAPPVQVESKEVVSEIVIEEHIKEEIKEPVNTTSSSNGNKKMVIGVLVGLGIVGLFFLAKILFFPPDVRDDSQIDEIIVADPATDVSPLEMNASASSTIPSSQGLSYTASNAVDGDLFSWWSPIRNANGREWLKIEFNRTAYISSIKIHGGSHYPNYTFKNKRFGNLYFMNLRVRQARLEFSDGSSELITLRDVDFVQEIVLKESVTTNYVKITPISSYAQVGGWDDYCISEVSFTF